VTDMAETPAFVPATEGFDPAMAGLETWPVATQMATLWSSQLAAVAAIGPALPDIARAVEAAVPRLRAGGRLVYAGAGSSGRLGAQDGAELPPTFDWPHERLVLMLAGGEGSLIRAVENAEDDADAGRRAVEEARIGINDVMIGVAASGRTPYAIACLEAARSAGALTIGLANSAGAPLLAASDCPILVQTGAEPIAGSTRMKAGTSQKIVLNLLSTGMMTGLGRVYRGRMVDMRAQNAKLRDRAVKMVVDLVGCTPEQATESLSQVGGRVKPAVIVARGATSEAALAALEATNGHLHAALASLGLASGSVCS